MLDKTRWWEAEGWPLSVLPLFFYAVEDYCHEDWLREPEDIDEAQMRARTRHALESLRRVLPLPAPTE